MKLGLFDMIGLVTSFAFALPVANFGVIRLLGGDTIVGAALLVVAIAMVVLPQYFLDPERIVRGLIVGLLPRRFRSGDPNDSEAAEK